MITRRNLLAAGAATLTTAFAPKLAWAAAPGAKRFVFIIQRGAADGLHIVPPLGDPGYAALRGPLVANLQGATKLNDVFSLHPALTRTAAMFSAKQALAVHAVASAYRDRSHFDGQDILETGARQAYAERRGWMNRLVALLPAGESKALAYAPDVPTALRGPAPVTSYAPSRLPAASSDLEQRVAGLYAGDAQLSALWQNAISTRAMAGAAESAQAGQNAAETGRVAASLLAPADGARLMMIETTGWDTHSAQPGRLTAQLTNLDRLIGALADGLGPAWNDTLVLVATEFGRTAAVNGTQGTDHGTASAALLLGGALAGGGRVFADWPGLSQSALYEGRDLKPTVPLEGVVAGALARHYGLDPVRVAAAIYPDQPGLKVHTV